MGAYGTTIDINDPFFRPLTDDRAILTQAIVMRLDTQRATYWTDPEYGLPVTNLLNEGLTDKRLARIPAEIAAELEKDERIAAVDVTTRIDGKSPSLRIILALRVSPVEGDTFPLTLAISDLTVELLTKGAA